VQRRLFSLSHIFLVATKSSQNIFYFEKVRGSRGEMRGRVELNQRAGPTMEADRNAGQARIFGDVAARRDAAGVGHIRVNHIDDLVVQKRFERAD
jgi:hypothetical protein